MSEEITWEDVIAVGKLIGIEVKSKGQASARGEQIYMLKDPSNSWPTYYVDPKSAMQELQLLAIRGAREWTATAEL